MFWPHTISLTSSFFSCLCKGTSRVRFILFTIEFLVTYVWGMITGIVSSVLRKSATQKHNKIYNIDAHVIIYLNIAPSSTFFSMLCQCYVMIAPHQKTSLIWTQQGVDLRLWSNPLLESQTNSFWLDWSPSWRHNRCLYQTGFVLIIPWPQRIFGNGVIFIHDIAIPSQKYMCNSKTSQQGTPFGLRKCVPYIEVSLKESLKQW